MNREDFKAFCLVLEPVMEFYNRRLSDKAVAMFFRYLDGMDLDQVKAGLRRHVQSCRFAPTPADLIQQIHGTDEDQAIEAWNIVRRVVARPGSSGSVRFWSPAIHFAIESMGGWVTFCHELDRNSEKVFTRLYLSALRRCVTWNEVRGHLPGSGEMSALFPEILEIGPTGDVVALEATH